MSTSSNFEQTGKGLYVFNEIEDFINCIITHYIAPKDPHFFLNYILNTSVVSFGAKIKILNNLDIFNKSEIKLIRNLSSFRNAFAHSNQTEHVEGDYEEIPRIFRFSINKVIYLTNAEGKIIKKDYELYVKEHIDIQNQVIDLICEFCDKHNIKLRDYNLFTENLQRYKV